MFEQYLNNPAAIWTIFTATAVGTGIVFDAGFRAFLKFRDMGLTNVLVIPETVGAKYQWHRVKLKPGQEWETKDGDEYQVKICSSDSAYPGTRGPLHVMSPYGSNLVAPSKDEAVDAKTKKPLKADAVLFQRFRIHDPLTYWRAKRENAMEDLYSAQREKDHWAVKLAPVAIMLFIALMGMLGFLLWRIMPLVQKAGG